MSPKYFLKVSYTKRFESERNNFTAAGNNDCNKNDRMDSVKSSLKYHPLWVTLHCNSTFSHKEFCLLTVEIVLIYGTHIMSYLNTLY